MAHLFAVLAVLLLAAILQELLLQVGGGSWLLLLLTPSRSHQLLEALSSPDVAPVQESLLSTPLQDSAANCAGTGAAWHQNCSLQHCTTLQKLLTNLY